MSRQEYLFTLIRSGLGLPNAQSFPLIQEKEWGKIRQLARNQKVEAICFDGIGKLPVSRQPAIPLRLEWGGCAIRTERQVHRHNKILQEVTAWLQSENIGFILLKGSAAANRYPKPHRRECGDIDLLITDNHFHSACLLIKQKGAAMISEAPEKHTAFLWQGVVIELHHTLIDFSRPQAVRYVRHMDFHSVSTIEFIDGKSYPVLKPAFDCAYMLAHLLHHLWTDGIRLRQICDWMMLMHRHGEEIQNEEFKSYLRHMRVNRVFPVLLGIGIKHFGLPAGKWGKTVKDTDYRMAEKLLQHILLPGQDTVRNDRHIQHSGSSGHWENMMIYTTRLRRFYPLSPEEALWFLPTRIRRFLYKKFPHIGQAASNHPST